MFDVCQRQRLRAARMIAVVVVALAVCSIATAHEGPPFPILMDKPLAGHLISVWADPDIGEARFYIVVEAATGEMPNDAPRVAMWAEPVSGRLERVGYEAARQTLNNQMQFEAKPYFDQRDLWTVGFQVTSHDGKTEELTTQIESTPPGFGPWDFAIYLFPFLLLGGMWVLAMVRRSRMEWPEPENSATTDDKSADDQRLVETQVNDGT